MQNVHFMLYDRQSQAQGRGHYQNKWFKMRQLYQNEGPNLAIIFSQVAYFDNVFTLGLYLTLVDFSLGVGCPIQWHFEGQSRYDNFNCLLIV
jgi:hypothetical protein